MSNPVQPNLGAAIDAFAADVANGAVNNNNNGRLEKVKAALQPLINHDAAIAAQAKDFAEADANRIALGTRIQNGLTTIGNKAFNFVSMPIAPMANAKTVEFISNPKDNAIVNLYKKIGNKTANLSKTIANKGEEISRKAGERTFTAIDGTFGKLSAGVSNVNKGTGNFILAIGKTLAVAISYVVRAVFLAISQLGQAAPAAMLVGTGVLTVVAGAKAVQEVVTSPILAVTAGAALVKAGNLENDVIDLRNELAALREQIAKDKGTSVVTKETVVEETTKTPAPVVVEAPVATTSKGKTALKYTVVAVLTAAAAAAALKFVGVPAVVESKIASIFGYAASNVTSNVCTLADKVIANTGTCSANATAYAVNL